MPSLIDIRRRIRSVKNTQQITKAMKMVSAAKLRRAQERVLAARPYSRSVRELLANVAAATLGERDETKHPLLVAREPKRITLIVVASDRGLAGAFNANLLKAGQQFLLDHAGADLQLELVGRKARDFFTKRYPEMVKGELTGLFLRQVKSSHAGELADRIRERYENAATDAVYLLFNEFRGVLSQNITLRQVLPVDIPRQTAAIDYLYEQPPAELLAELLPRYFENQIFQALLESSASEEAARMTAMDAATTNAGGVIDKLTLYMNRVRQASITKEIIEVVSGASALE